jgi:4-hydroxy-3-methylbut-2-en-1-yl diphosphate synthase IspG/GcpE
MELTTINDTIIEQTGSYPGKPERVICPSCGANQTLLREMMHEADEVYRDTTGRIRIIESGNRATARFILDNCRTCKEVVGK